MRWISAALCVVWAGMCLAADAPPASPSLCSNATKAPSCSGSPDDLKAARQAFAHGLKLEKEQKHSANSGSINTSQLLNEAFLEFEEAARLVPHNVEYVTARELTRQHLAGMHLARGDDALRAGRQVESMAEFRTALELDPQNEFAQQRLQDALGAQPPSARGKPQVVASADELKAKPSEGRDDFHYRGDSRGLLTTIATRFGLTIIFDDSFPSRQVRFDIENADFATAIREASAITKSFTVAVEDTVLFVSAENPENHRLYDRMGLRSFYIPGGGTPNELNEFLNALRALFDFRFTSLNVASSTITVRGTQPLLQAATELLDQLNGSKPEVMLDLKVFQVSHTYAHNIGLHVPNQFNLFNIPVAALAALGGQNIQSLINQLISSGGINQAGNQSISALLAQLQGQQNSIFSQPLATFGGGLTFSGLSLDHLAAALTMSESSVRSLEHVTLRASQEKEATLKLGSRYPILNGSFAPVFNNAAISQVLGNQSFAAPFPSVNYEDIGLSLKAKPVVHNNSDVALEIEVQLRSLGTTNNNGIPDILNREYKGGILVKEGEPAVIAGMITASDQRSLSGLPLFSEIPGLGLLTAQSTKNQDNDELLILITPYVIRSAEHPEAQEIWLSK